MPKAYPSEQAFAESVALRKSEHGVHGFAIHEPKIARPVRDFDLRYSVEQLVKECGSRAFQSRVGASRRPNAINDFVAVAPFVQECRNQLRRILKVRVDDDNRRATRVSEPRRQRRFLSEVAR